jgi:hypothetical protein
MLESVQGIIKLDGCAASIDDANDTAHDNTLNELGFLVALCATYSCSSLCFCQTRRQSKLFSGHETRSSHSAGRRYG